MIDRHDHLRRDDNPPERTVFPAPQMSRQSDPVPALDRSHLLFQILYDDDLTAFLVGESGQTEGIHENLRQSTVKTSPDSMQLLQAFLRKRVPQILRHDPITVTQQAQRTENGRFHHVIAKPIRQNGEKLTENPEAFQSDPSPKTQIRAFLSFYLRLTHSISVLRTVSHYRPSCGPKATCATAPGLSGVGNPSA